MGNSLVQSQPTEEDDPFWRAKPHGRRIPDWASISQSSNAMKATAPSAPDRERGNRPDYARLARQLARRQESLHRRVSRLEEEADSLALDLAALADDLDAGSVRGVSTSNRGLLTSRHRTGEDARDALRRTAEAGAASLAITPRSDGFAEVQVDGGKLFTLPPTLAELLSILASNRGREEEDGLVGWKTIDEIARLLEKKAGRSFTTHAVTQQIHRLRRELFVRGRANPWLVQTHRRSGARFALRLVPEARPAVGV